VQSARDVCRINCTIGQAEEALWPHRTPHKYLHSVNYNEKITSLRRQQIIAHRKPLRPVINDSPMHSMPTIYVHHCEDKPRVSVGKCEKRKIKSLARCGNGSRWPIICDYSRASSASSDLFQFSILPWSIGLRGLSRRNAPLALMTDSKINK
jgi:hypothetical protein